MSDLFRERPKKWWLPGNVYFWETLQTMFAFEEIDMSEEEFVDRIVSVFVWKTQDDLKEDSVYYVDDYDFDGIGDGLVSGEWVLEVCIPLLLERFRKLSPTC